MNITILGAGAWGTALAIALAERHRIVLWGRSAVAMQEASVRRENVDYFPGFALPDQLTVTSDFDMALAHVAANGDADDGLLILASSVAGLRPLLQRLQSRPLSNVVWLCKGFEESSRLLPHQVVHDILGSAIAAGVLSGPSFAQEVAQGLPCALTVASTNAELCERVVHALHGRNIRVYSTDDVVGVEVGAAVKNILAIATGVTDGMGLGLNARAALITRGLAEITRLGVALGGRPETFTGLTGVGDLILTCTGDLSRNRKVGLALAQGKSLDTIVAELGHVAEGVHCARAVRSLAIELNIEMPITTAVAAVLFDGESPQATVAQLLSRDPRQEAA
ncbi:MAG: glycerol-3-phosphate dehydrogenase [Burkholderiales bacterium RIFCSPLOWO2_02_FULL_57_36]|nr:MAG: glycerol-3-phosphate dehydrogenase [Burkholderiales bacterium RIFCSPLOWO2_02_FULL_57_36]